MSASPNEPRNRDGALMFLEILRTMDPSEGTQRYIDKREAEIAAERPTRIGFQPNERTDQS